MGPSDLAIAVGGAFPGDPAIEAEFNAALETVAEAAASAGIAAGIHTAAGEIAAQRLRQGYTFTTVASDLTHLEQAAKAHLAAASADAARGLRPCRPPTTDAYSTITPDGTVSGPTARTSPTCRRPPCRATPPTC